MPPIKKVQFARPLQECVQMFGYKSLQALLVVASKNTLFELANTFEDKNIKLPKGYKYDFSKTLDENLYDIETDLMLKDVVKYEKENKTKVVDLNFFETPKPNIIVDQTKPTQPKKPAKRVRVLDSLHKIDDSRKQRELKEERLRIREAKKRETIRRNEEKKRIKQEERLKLQQAKLDEQNKYIAEVIKQQNDALRAENAITENKLETVTDNKGNLLEQAREIIRLQSEVETRNNVPKVSNKRAPRTQTPKSHNVLEIYNEKCLHPVITIRGIYPYEMKDKGNGKVIEDGKYVLFNDGTMFSQFTGKWIKPKVHANYYDYTLGGRRNTLVHRLVYFHFGKHNYTKIADMDNIVLRDLKKGCHIDNLIEMKQSEMHELYNIKPTQKCHDRAKESNTKIQESDKHIITNMINMGISYIQIARIYSTGETCVNPMSVKRFVDRHEIKKDLTEIGMRHKKSFDDSTKEINQTS